MRRPIIRPRWLAWRWIMLYSGFLLLIGSACMLDSLAPTDDEATIGPMMALGGLLVVLGGIRIAMQTDAPAGH